MASLPVQHSIDSSNHLLRTLKGNKRKTKAFKLTMKWFQILFCSSFAFKLLLHRLPPGQLVFHREVSGWSGPWWPHRDLHQVDGLHEAWLGSEHGGVEDAASRRDDLSTATVDGVCVKGDVLDVETNGPHVLLTQGSLVQGKVFI